MASGMMTLMVVGATLMPLQAPFHRHCVIPYGDPSLHGRSEASQVQCFRPRQRSQGDCWTCHRSLSPAPTIGLQGAITPEQRFDSEADLTTSIMARLRNRPDLASLVARRKP